MAISLVQHTSASSGSTAQASIAATLTGTTAGNLFTIGVTWYTPSGVTTTVTTNNGTSCSQATNAFATDGSDTAAIWYGANNAASGSVTFTATFSGAGGNFPTIQVQEWSGAATVGVDVGIGNGRTDAAVTNISISTNGTTTDDNQLIYSIETPSSTAPTSAGGSQTLLESNISSYQLIDSNGTTITHTYGYAGSQNVASVIAAFTPLAQLMGQAWL